MEGMKLKVGKRNCEKSLILAKINPGKSPNAKCRKKRLKIAFYYIYIFWQIGRRKLYLDIM